MNKKTFVAAISLFLSVALSTAHVSAAEYTVQPGDTLWRIAHKHGISISDLREWNKLTNDIILPNQPLKVSKKSSAPVSVTPVSPPVLSSSYTVKSGDSLYRIANQFQVSISDLKQWNHLLTNTIFVGQQLRISSSHVPTPTVPAPVITPVPSAPATSVLTYRVSVGDTLSKIGSKHNVNVNQLKTWNNLKSDLIYIGQSLQMYVSVGAPSAPTSPPAPKIVTGDAASSPVTVAQSLLGTPYLWGGTTPDGFDCSGFIYYVYKQAGISMGRTSTLGYYNYAVPVTSPELGDIVFFRDTYKPGISHMGIYLGNNQFIHAGSSGGVQITSLDHPYWKPKFDSFKRFN